MLTRWVALVVVVLAAGCGGDDREAVATRTPEPTKAAPIVADAHEAAEWIADALESSGYDADFSPASAKELDRFFEEQLTAPGKPRPGGLLAEDRGARLFALASYTGEVIRRNGDGWEWAPAEGDPDDEINLQLKHGDEVIWPVKRVMKRYENGPEDSLHAYVAAALEP